jgi:hypothetical protein
LAFKLAFKKIKQPWKIEMRLVPLNDSDNSWGSLKAQWKTEAEREGDDFSTFALEISVLDSIASQDSSKAGLYGLYDGRLVRAVCQVNRVLTGKYTSPVLRARLIAASPIYDLGSAEDGGYAQVLIATFSGVVWLSQNSLPARHIKFHLRSPADGRYFAALQAKTPLSPFSRFSVKGIWVECGLKAR